MNRIFLNVLFALILILLPFLVTSQDMSTLDETHFTPVGPNGCPYSIIINLAYVNGDDLTSGDEVGIFDGDLCVGTSVYPDSMPFSVTTWQAVEAFDLPGFQVGNEIIFVLWKSNLETELECVADFTEGDGTFGDGLFSAVNLNAYVEVKEKTENLPQNFKLLPAYPNPFNSQVSVPFVLNNSGNIHISVYNTLGQTILDEQKHYSPGHHRYLILAENGINSVSTLNTGVYFVRFEFDGQLQTQKIVYLK